MNHHTHFQQTQHFPYSYKKKIDAFVSADNIVSSYTGVFPVEKLGKEPYYLAVAKGHKNLLNELNMSLSVIDGQDGLFLNELKNKYSSLKSAARTPAKERITSFSPTPLCWQQLKA